MKVNQISYKSRSPICFGDISKHTDDFRLPQEKCKLTGFLGYVFNAIRYSREYVST